MCKCVIQKTIWSIQTSVQAETNIQTALQKNSSHCKSHLQLTSALIYTYIHTCHPHAPLLPRARLQQQQQLPLRRSEAHAGPSPGAVPKRSDPELSSTDTAARWYLVISTDSPRIHEYFRSIQSSKHWRSKKCSQLCFLKDTAMLTLLSILQRC